MKLDLNNRLHKLVTAGILAALILLLTMVVAIPIPHMAGVRIDVFVSVKDTGKIVYIFQAFRMCRDPGILPLKTHVK